MTRCVADPAGCYLMRGKAGKYAFCFLGAFGRINNLLLPSEQGSLPAPSDDSAGRGAIRCRRGIGLNTMILSLSGGKAGDEGAARSPFITSPSGFLLLPLAPPV